MSGGLRRQATPLIAVAAALGLALATSAAGARAAPTQPGETFTLAWGGDVTPGSAYGLPPGHGATMLAGWPTS